jgi:hypothetical protein
VNPDDPSGWRAHYIIDLFDTEAEATLTAQVRDERLAVKQMLEAAECTVRWGEESRAQALISIIDRGSIDLVAITIYSSIAQQVLQQVNIPILPSHTSE